MPVNPDHLVDFSGGVAWSEEDKLAAERTLVAVTAQLGHRLNTYIEAGPERIEYAIVSPTSGLRPGGLLCTGHRIFELLELDGADVAPAPSPDAPQPAPTGWEWADTGRLRCRDWTGRGGTTRRVRYLPGLPITAEIEQAILRKTHALVANRNDDTVVARGTELTPPPLLREEWSDAELGDLKRFYNIGIFR